MPLFKSKSKKAFSHNVAAEMDAGKPQNQSLAVAYAMKRKAKAYGGDMQPPKDTYEHSSTTCTDPTEMAKMAAGGYMTNPDHQNRMRHESAASEYRHPLNKENYASTERAVGEEGVQAQHPNASLGVSEAGNALRRGDAEHAKALIKQRGVELAEGGDAGINTQDSAKNTPAGVSEAGQHVRRANQSERGYDLSGDIGHLDESEDRINRAKAMHRHTLGELRRMSTVPKLAGGGAVGTDEDPSQDESDLSLDDILAINSHMGTEDHSGDQMHAEGGQITGNYGSPGSDLVDRIMRSRSDRGHGSQLHDEDQSGFMSHEGDTLRPSGRATSEDDASRNQEHSVHAAATDWDDGDDYMEEPGQAMSDPPHGGDDKPEDVVERIMRNRAKMYAHGGMYSEGGKVANDDHSYDTKRMAGSRPDQFDDLVLDDDLSSEYTGANSGDELGDAREDHDRKDIVSKIMKSRAKRDRLPRPA
jgi:hypothetical protein